MKLKTISCISVLLCCTCFGAENTGGAKLFIAPMDGGLDGFIATEVVKQKIPVSVVTDEKDADYVLVGASLKADDHWYNTVFGGKDKNEGNVRVLEVKTKR